MVEVFGDVGRHARSAVACPSLPLGTPVEIDAIVKKSLKSPLRPTRTNARSPQRYFLRWGLAGACWYHRICKNSIHEWVVRALLLQGRPRHRLDKANRMSTNPQARYVQGNILSHLIQAAAASSVGMLAIFLVDLADLYFISLLGVPQLAAAVGFSGMLFFLAASIGMALSVAASTLVSQALTKQP